MERKRDMNEQHGQALHHDSGRPDIDRDAIDFGRVQTVPREIAERDERIKTQQAEADRDKQPIVAAIVDAQDHAECLRAALREAGIAESDIDVFFVNPVGQHGQHPVGGDEGTDLEAQRMPGGAVTGAAVGAAAGAAVGAVASIAVPPLAPAIMLAATGVGAYTGAMAGGVTSGGEETPEHLQPQPGHRRSGMMVATRVTDVADMARLGDILRANGADHVEQSRGTWRDGHWIDFDPVSLPQMQDSGRRMQDSAKETGAATRDPES